MYPKFYLASFALTCSLLFASHAYAATCTTTASGNWSDPAIWSCGHAPATGDDVEIVNNVTVDISTDAVASVTVGTGATLTFAGGQKINMEGPNSLFKIQAGADVDGGNPGSKIIYPAPGTSISGPFNQAGPVTSNGSGAFVAGIPLPLSLLSFTAVQQEGKVTAYWQTAFEKNIASFVVERSTDGKTFSKVSEQIMPANTAAQHDYSWSDKQPATGTSYYRLRISEFDGSSSLSGTTVVNAGIRNATTALFPNPALD